MYADYTPEYTHFRPGWTSAPGLRKGERTLLRSFLLRALYSHWLDNVNLSSLLMETDWHKIPPAVALENAQRNSPTGFARNMDTLLKNIRQDGATPVIVDFLLAEEATTKRNEGAKYMLDYYRAIAAGTYKDIAEREKLSAKYGLLRISLDPKEFSPFFIDHCHLNEKGDRLKAERLAERIAPLIK